MSRDDVAELSGLLATIAAQVAELRKDVESQQKRQTDADVASRAELASIAREVRERLDQRELEAAEWRQRLGEQLDRLRASLPCRRKACVGNDAQTRAFRKRSPKKG